MTSLQQVAEAIAADAPEGADVALALRLVGGRGAGAAGRVNADVLHVTASSAKTLWIAAVLEQVPPERIATLAEEVFRTSSNELTGTIIDLIGIDAVNGFLRRIGLQDTALVRWRYGHERRATQVRERMGDDNYSTADDLVRFLEGLHAGRWPAGRAAVLREWMRHAPREGHCGWIGARLPEPDRAALMHKGGSLAPGTTSDDRRYRTLNEMGLMRRGDRICAFAVLSRYGPDWDARQRWMEQAGLRVYESL